MPSMVSKACICNEVIRFVGMVRCARKTVWFVRKWYGGTCARQADKTGRAACSPQPPSLSSTFPLETTNNQLCARRQRKTHWKGDDLRTLKIYKWVRESCERVFIGNHLYLGLSQRQREGPRFFVPILEKTGWDANCNVFIIYCF